MFIELVHGKARDTEQLHRVWVATLRSLKATGVRWLGATSGSTGDGEFMAMLAFESEEGARLTADLLDDQGVWRTLDSSLRDLRFSECPHVRAFASGNPSRADCVEVTGGTAKDISQLMEYFETVSRSARRDETLLGGLVCWDADGAATGALYRRSKPASATAKRMSDAADRAFKSRTYFELTRPWSVLTWGVSPPLKRKPSSKAKA